MVTCVECRKLPYFNRQAMTDQFLTGKWTGKFIYEHGYSDAVKGKLVIFDLQVISTSGHFSGYCTDAEQLRFMKVPATIEGYVQGELIYFTKRYANATFLNQDGSMLAYTNRPPHDIHYTGYWGHGQYSGKWEIFALNKLSGGHYNQQLSAGTWFMKKTKEKSRSVRLFNVFKRRLKRFFSQ